jgi:glycosyltransferase involved in cell wall biosynthesis
MPIVEITIPVLNEEDQLEASISVIDRFLTSNNYTDIKIIIGDNGSTDKTDAIAQRLCQTYPWLSYVRVEGRGVGRALKKTWGDSTADIVGCMDLDLATDLKHIPEMLAAFEQGVDVVYGSRLHKQSVVVGRSLKREILSRGLNFIVRNSLGVAVSDVMCGFEFLRRPLYPILVAGGAVSDGWFFSAELLVVADWKGLKLAELPLKWTDSPSSKVRVVSLTLEYLKAIRVLRTRR